MGIGAEEPEGDRTTTEQKGRLLQPASQGVLKQVLQHCLAREPDFAAEYFPLVKIRGYATYGDVFELSDRQADALRPIMAESVHYFLKLDGRERNRNINPFTRAEVDPSYVSFPARKAKFWADAARDVCRVYGLESPL
jgi:hypothetical protein